MLNRKQITVTVKARIRTEGEEGDHIPLGGSRRKGGQSEQKEFVTVTNCPTSGSFGAWLNPFFGTELIL